MLNHPTLEKPAHLASDGDRSLPAVSNPSPPKVRLQMCPTEAIVTYDFAPGATRLR